VGFSVASHLKKGTITAMIQFSSSRGPLTELRLRVPEGNKISSVMLDGKPWTQYDAREEAIILPSNAARTVSLTIFYQ
jgi:hypothetical protein